MYSHLLCTLGNTQQCLYQKSLGDLQIFHGGEERYRINFGGSTEDSAELGCECNAAIVALFLEIHTANISLNAWFSSRLKYGH